MINTQSANGENTSHGKQRVDEAIEITEWFANSLKKEERLLFKQDVSISKAERSLVSTLLTSLGDSTVSDREKVHKRFMQCSALFFIVYSQFLI